MLPPLDKYHSYEIIDSFFFSFFYIVRFFYAYVR